MSDLGIKPSRKLCVKWKCSSALRVVRTKFDICVFYNKQDLSLCMSYQHFMILLCDWIILINLLNQELLLVKLKSTLPKFYDRHHDLVNHYKYLCNKWPRICFLFRNHNPTLSSFMTYHQVFDKRNTMDATMEHELRTRQGYNLFFLWGSCLLIL